MNRIHGVEYLVSKTYPIPPESQKKLERLRDLFDDYRQYEENWTKQKIIMGSACVLVGIIILVFSEPQPENKIMGSIALVGGLAAIKSSI